MTYAQFRESGAGADVATTEFAQNLYLFVLIDFYRKGRKPLKIPESRPARLCGR
ncbi:hypothetical protein BLAT2472_60267 [Burkholderia latens]